jgi:hypothetical protein
MKEGGDFDTRIGANLMTSFPPGCTKLVDAFRSLLREKDFGAISTAEMARPPVSRTHSYTNTSRTSGTSF